MRSNAKRNLLAASILMVGILATLFSGYEMSAESWGYWFFARVLVETGHFIVPDRGPVYTIYLNLFRWMGYPSCVVIEYICTSFITLLSIWILFRSILGNGWALFSVLLWLPFLQTAEPPVQSLALACSCLAVHLRRSTERESGRVVSYALLVLAGMLRVTNFVLFALFVAADLWTLIRHNKFRASIVGFRPKFVHWPLAMLLLLMVSIRLLQSTHPSNTVWFADAEWFPVQGKSLAEGSMLQYMNWSYLDNTGQTKESDWYFSNQDLFGQAKSLGEAFHNNPRIILSYVAYNLTTIIPVSLSITQIKLFSPNFLRGPASLTLYLLMILLVWRVVRDDRHLLLFIAGSFVLVWATAPSRPQERYMVAFIPVLILCGWSVANVLLELLSKAFTNGLFWKALRSAVILSSLVVFSMAPRWSKSWEGLLAWAHGESIMLLGSREPLGSIEDNKGVSMRRAYSFLAPLASICGAGVMTMEHTFVGAFIDIPLNALHEIWEVPPFGEYGDDNYKGLHLNRVPCLFVSENLRSGWGNATNPRPRFRAYIGPYFDDLVRKGARVIDVPEYGAVLLAPAVAANLR